MLFRRYKCQVYLSIYLFINLLRYDIIYQGILAIYAIYTQVMRKNECLDRFYVILRKHLIVLLAQNIMAKILTGPHVRALYCKKFAQDSFEAFHAILFGLQICFASDVNNNNVHMLECAIKELRKL